MAVVYGIRSDNKCKREVVPKSKIIELSGSDSGSNLTSANQKYVRRIKLYSDNPSLDGVDLSECVIVGLMERYGTSPWYSEGSAYGVVETTGDVCIYPNATVNNSQITMDLYAPADGTEVHYRLVLLQMD